MLVIAANARPTQRTTMTSKLLTVHQRRGIQKRNPDNKDIEALLAESDEFRRLAVNAERRLQNLQELYDKERRDHRATESKLKHAKTDLKRAEDAKRAAEAKRVKQ